MVEEPDNTPPARHEPWQAAPLEALASWLAGHCQAMGGGTRDPAPSIGDIDSWYLGYDVGIRDRQEGDDSGLDGDA